MSKRKQVLAGLVDLRSAGQQSPRRFLLSTRSGRLNIGSAEVAVQAADFIAVVHILIFAVTMTSLIRATGIATSSALVGSRSAACAMEVQDVGDRLLKWDLGFPA